MNLGWSSSGGNGGSGGSGSDYVHPPTHPSTMILHESANFASNKLDEILEELFISGNDIKNGIEAAVISKGGTVSKAGEIATKEELIAGILSILTETSGMQYATGNALCSPKGYGNFYTGSGTAVAAYSYKIEDNGLAFKPRIIRYRKQSEDITAGNDMTWSEFGKNVEGDYNYVKGYHDTFPKVVVQHNVTGEKYRTDSLAMVWNGGFFLPAEQNGIFYTWDAWG